MPSIADCRRRELASKLTALPHELDTWRAMSEAGQPFEKHNTQIRRLAAQIAGLHATVIEAFEQLDEEAVLRDGRRIETRLLAVQSVWDYFRSKLVLRGQEPFAAFLRAADAFAWACYQPVQQQQNTTAADDRREPPLVAPQNVWSPNALPRDRAYAVARTPGGWTDTAPFVSVIESLPVPILGMPWFQLEHLPHVALLAHEVGHVVEHDFGLEARNDRVITDATIADATRRPAWLAWRQELFADFFGCYAAGPAFVWALAETLATGTSIVTNELRAAPNWGDYPTGTLRVSFNLIALEALQHTDEAAAIRTAWQDTYHTHRMAAFEPDCRPIVEAWLAAEMLPASLRYTGDVVEQETIAVRLLNAGWPLNPQHTRDARALVSAASRFYRTHADDAAIRARWADVRDAIIAARPPGILGPGDAAATGPIPPADADRQRGRLLAAPFFAALEQDA